MGPTSYTPEKAERLIEWIKNYPFPYFIAEKSTTVPISYTKEEAIVLMKSRIRQ